MPFETRLIHSLARHLATTTGALTYQGSGAGAPIHVDQLPTTPDHAVAVSLYPVDDNTGHTTTTVGVQFRIRGRPNQRSDVKDTADLIHDTLHDWTGGDLDGIPVIRCWQQSGGTLPVDGNNRQHITRNYYLTLTRETRHRRD